MTEQQVTEQVTERVAEQQITGQRDMTEQRHSWSDDGLA